MEYEELSSMMLDSYPLNKFFPLIDRCEDTDALFKLLDFTLMELCYELVGGDHSFMEKPPINQERIAYLEELSQYLQAKGVAPRAIDE